MTPRLLHPLRLLLASLLLAACGESAPRLTGDALAQRRAATRELAGRLVPGADRAFVGREELIVRDKRLVTPALDRIMAGLETWIDGDESRLRSFLETQVISAGNELITSPDGIAVLDQLAQAAFARPRVEVREGDHPGRKAGEIEKQAAKIAGTVLSGRPAEARDLPASHWIEVRADFGLLPVPLEVNPRNKHSVSLLRHRADAGKDWLDDQHRERPRVEVVERLARDLLRQHPKATRLILHLQVLRTLGAPVKWEFNAAPSSDGTITVAGSGTAPGCHEDFGTHQCSR